MRAVIEPFEAIGNRIVGPCGMVTITEYRVQAVFGAHMLNEDESLREIVDTRKLMVRYH